MTFEKKLEILEKAIQLQDKMYKREMKLIIDDDNGDNELDERQRKEAERLSTMFETRKTTMMSILEWMQDDRIAEDYLYFLNTVL